MHTCEELAFPVLAPSNILMSVTCGRKLSPTGLVIRLSLVRFYFCGFLFSVVPSSLCIGELSGPLVFIVFCISFRCFLLLFCRFFVIH